MIYTIGFNHEGFRVATFEEAIDYLERSPVVGLDIETTRKFKGIYGKREGLDPYLTNIVMIQIGDLNRQFVIDVRKVDYEDITYMFKRLNARKVKFLGHNMKFEFKHIYHNFGVRLEYILDTMIMETIIYNGLNVTYDLKGLIKKYLNYEVDKDIRMSFLSIGDIPFNRNQIIYGVEDITLPLQFYEIQFDKIRENNSEMCLKLEMNFLPALAMMEYNGFTIDVEAWTALAELNGKRYEEQSKKLTELLLDILPEDSIYINKQYNLFDETRTLRVKFSSREVVDMFKTIGVDCQVTDKKTKKVKNSLESKALKSYMVVNKEVLPPEVVTIIKEYMKLKEYEQSCTTFGVKFLEQYVHPITGKLHSNFKQIIETGRLSSSNPNIQNIPSSKEFRKCFTATEGNILINADYSSKLIDIIRIFVVKRINTWYITNTTKLKRILYLVCIKKDTPKNI